MDIKENISLKSYSTMRLGGQARYVAEANDETEIPRLVSWAKSQNIPFMSIGIGSNIVWRDEGYPGLLIINKLKGLSIISEDEHSAILHISAGEIWDEVVSFAVSKNLSGIEFLSLIPGTAGAAPVQNIGGYGTELSHVLKEVGVYDSKIDAFGSIEEPNCGFGYRTSRFKTVDRNRFVITNLTLHLSKNNPQPPFYDSLQKYLNEHEIKEYTPQIIRDAVVNIRSSKLPDPAEVANNGSFFVNPVVEKLRYEALQDKYPELNGWPTKDGKVKLPAAQILDIAGLRGIHDEETGMATWPTQALVLVNERAKSTADLIRFKEKIIDKVQELFGITLEQEPELLP